MASMTYARLVSANTRDGVDTRKKVNSAVPREVRRGDKPTVATIAVLGNPAVTNWGDMMTGMHAGAAWSNLPAVVPTVPSAIRLYTDMADEPWKYGDDIISWLDMDEKLQGNPERDAYWQDREAREEAARFEQECAEAALQKMWRYRFYPVMKEAAKVSAKRWVERDIKRHVQRIRGAAIKIQALVRGYQTRCKDAHQDCCMCLSHRISPLKTTVGYMCRDCAELGPYEDLVEEDPWNWHRAEYVDEAPNHHLYQPCGWCNKDFIAPLWNGDYCSYECEYYDRNA